MDHMFIKKGGGYEDTEVDEWCNEGKQDQKRIHQRDGQGGTDSK